MTQRRYGDVVFEQRGRVAWVLLDRADAHNALSPSVLNGLNSAVGAAIEAECSVFVLRGAGGSLSAGADLNHLRTLGSDRQAVREYITAIGTTLDRIEAAPFVSVAVVEQFALAGGCEILLTCDLSVVSEDARIGDRHLEYGLLPGAGGSVRLSRAIPAPLARRLLYTGEMVDGRTAASFGLVSYAVAEDELADATDRLITRLTRHPADAVGTMKRLHGNASALPPEQAIAAEREVLFEHLESDTVREGLAAFAERRPPRFADPDADDTDPEEGNLAP